jgi:ABC-type polysaccharide/polyol phosphate export permease
MRKIINEILNTPFELYKYRRLIFDMTTGDFKRRYLGSYLGILWAFINPIVTIAIFIFVFQMGFKATPVSKIPFVIWLSTGIIPWFYFSDAFASSASSICEYSFLVKKVVFRVSFLPLIRVLSSIFIHLCFIFLVILILLFYGMMPSLYWLQAVYYLFCSIVLLVGFAWISASLMVFVKDIGNLVGIILQFGFWMTPIFWRIEQIPKKYQIILKLNPVFYIIQGYRDSFLFKNWFWQRPNLTLYFWIVTIITLILGLFIFKKTRPHFADVL